MTIDFKDDKKMERAIYWHVRLLSGDFSSQEMEEFLNWQQAHTENAAYLQYVEENGAVLEEHKDKIQDALNSNKHRILPAMGKMRWIGAVAASLIMIVTALVSFAPFAERHTTAIGEQKTIYLADGSSVFLNTNTALKVDMGDEERAINLIKGEAFFQVTPDKNRPFMVAVGQRVIRVVGTKFNIFRTDNETTLSVTEGVVAILKGTDDNIIEQQVLAGQQIIINQKNEIGKTIKLNHSNVTAWKEGQLVYEDILLEDFIQDLNRYYAGKIILQDKELGKMRISGVFQIGDRNKAIKAVENLLNLKAMPLTSNNVVLYSGK